MPHEHGHGGCCGGHGKGCGGHGHHEHGHEHVPGGASAAAQPTAHRCGAGAEAVCVCPKCGAERPHRPGSPCKQDACDACGSRMLRKGSFHHTRLLAKRAEG